MRIQLIIVCIFFLTQNIFSQKETPLNNPIYDNQAYHFGFSLGVSQNKFQIEYTDVF